MFGGEYFRADIYLTFPILIQNRGSVENPHGVAIRANDSVREPAFLKCHYFTRSIACGGLFDAFIVLFTLLTNIQIS
jgi:hypothetical protein